VQLDLSIDAFRATAIVAACAGSSGDFRVHLGGKVGLDAPRYRPLG
jgi:hypothetical protein